MLLSRIALLACLAGCPVSAENLPECSAVDTASVTLLSSTLDNEMMDISDGSRVPLLGAPQGGHIMLVGARVRAARDCKLTANAALRDPTSMRVIGLEERSLLLDRRSDGWAVPRDGLDSMPNVAVCPSSATTTAIYDRPFLLEVTLLSLSGAPIVTRKAQITPTCSDEWCRGDCGGPLPN